MEFSEGLDPLNVSATGYATVIASLGSDVTIVGMKKTD